MPNKLDTLDPHFRKKVDVFLAALKEAGIDVAVVCCRRAIAEQNALYAKGRTAPGEVVTNARGGSSPHNFGQAVDVCPVRKGQLWWNANDATWKRIAEIGSGCGLTPGYYFKTIHDAPHFEDPGWRIVQAAWKRGEVHVA